MNQCVAFRVIKSTLSSDICIQFRRILEVKICIRRMRTLNSFVTSLISFADRQWVFVKHCPVKLSGAHISDEVWGEFQSVIKQFMDRP